MSQSTNRISISGVTETPILSGDNGIVCSVIFQVTAASSLSMVTNILLAGSGNSSVNCQCVNIATGAVTPAGTAITANGVYGVFAPGCGVTVTPSAGTCTIDACVVAGRVL